MLSAPCSPVLGVPSIPLPPGRAGQQGPQRCFVETLSATEPAAPSPWISLLPGRASWTLLPPGETLQAAQAKRPLRPACRTRHQGQVLSCPCSPQHQHPGMSPQAPSFPSGCAPTGTADISPRSPRYEKKNTCREVTRSPTTIVVGHEGQVGTPEEDRSAGGFSVPPEQGGLRAARRSTWTTSRQSPEQHGTKSSQLSEHQRVTRTDTAMRGAAGRGGWKKTGEINLIPKAGWVFSSCAAFAGWLLLRDKSGGKDTHPWSPALTPSPPLV